MTTRCHSGGSGGQVVRTRTRGRSPRAAQQSRGLIQGADRPEVAHPITAEEWSQASGDGHRLVECGLIPEERLAVQVHHPGLVGNGGRAADLHLGGLLRPADEPHGVDPDLQHGFQGGGSVPDPVAVNPAPTHGTGEVCQADSLYLVVIDHHEPGRNAEGDGPRGHGRNLPQVDVEGGVPGSLMIPPLDLYRADQPLAGHGQEVDLRQTARLHDGQTMPVEDGRHLTFGGGIRFGGPGPRTIRVSGRPGLYLIAWVTPPCACFRVCEWAKVKTLSKCRRSIIGQVTGWISDEPHRHGQSG